MLSRRFLISQIGERQSDFVLFAQRLEGAFQSDVSDLERELSEVLDPADGAYARDAAFGLALIELLGLQFDFATMRLRMSDNVFDY